MNKYFEIEKIFKYPEDKLELVRIFKMTKNILFGKLIISYFLKYKDKDVPNLIIDFSKKRHTKGHRASMIILLENFDCNERFDDIFNIFLTDTFNTTWYCYDILIKYIKNQPDNNLITYKDLTIKRLSMERIQDKRDYFILFLRKLEKELNKRGR